MADKNEVGYGKPPKHSQFTKGQSGNPKGRPKGSQNLSTLLEKIGRQRVKVTENGRTRELTKFEATILQLTNKAVHGDLKATNELRYWIQAWTDSVQPAMPSPLMHKNDEAVIASAIERIRQSESESSNQLADPTATDPSEEDK